jgi:putative ABC transport system ATP-binding protein
MTSDALAQRGDDASAGGVMIEIEGLHKSYGAVSALRGVSLRVARRDAQFVIGPSGCGKSTLLHLLGGLDRPTSGEVWLDGRRVDGLSETRWAVLRRKQVGFVFQFFNLIGNLTVADNVELPALLAGTAPGEARRKRDALLAELGLADKADRVPARLSGGQQQRVAIARSLINQPTVLMADEPTGNLDTDSTRDVIALLRRYHDAGQTILLVTHDPRVASVADRIVTMRDGVIADETRMSAEVDPLDVLSNLIRLEA